MGFEINLYNNNAAETPRNSAETSCYLGGIAYDSANYTGSVDNSWIVTNSTRLDDRVILGVGGTKKVFVS